MRCVAHVPVCSCVAMAVMPCIEGAGARQAHVCATLSLCPPRCHCVQGAKPKKAKRKSECYSAAPWQTPCPHAALAAAAVPDGRLAVPAPRQVSSVVHAPCGSLWLPVNKACASSARRGPQRPQAGHLGLHVLRQRHAREGGRAREGQAGARGQEGGRGMCLVRITGLGDRMVPMSRGA